MSMELITFKSNLEYEAEIKSVPIKGIVDYLLTRSVRSSTVTKVPRSDESSSSSDMKQREATQDFEFAKQYLETEKGKYEVRLEKMEQEWEGLKLKEIELSEEFKKNDRVIKSNEKGWEKLEKQTAEELARKGEVQDEVVYLEEKLKLYETIETKLKKRVSKFEIYEDFLKQVVNEYPLYTCMDDVLNHYESLTETRDEMKGLHLKSLILIEEMRKEVEDLTEEGSALIFNLSRSLHRLRMEEYLLHKELCHWAQMIENLQDIENRSYQNTFNAMEGVWLVYLNIYRTWNQDPLLKKNELQAQLDYIVEHIFLMKCILEESETYLSEPNLKLKVPSNRELDKWSTDYEDFELVLSTRAVVKKD